MSRLLAKKLVFGPNSPEYEKALEDFNGLKSSRNGTLAPKGENPAPEKTSEDRFTGRLTGTWSGTYSANKIKAKGSFQIQVSADGQVSGRFSGDDSGSLTGRLDPSGSMDVKTGGGQAGTYHWTGTISRSSNGSFTGRGAWSARGAQGTWQGSGG